MLSSHNVRLSTLAESDICESLQYVAEELDVDHAHAYSAWIHEAIEGVLDLPEMDRRREDLQSDVLSCSIGRHVLFFTLRGDTMNVLRVIHSDKALENLLDLVSA